MPFAGRKVADNCTQCEFRKLRLFCNLGDEALKHFDRIGMHVSFPSRVTLFEEGERASGVYIVCTGQLKLSTTSQQGRTMILRLAGPGDVLGLSAILSDLPHEVTAETLEPSQFKNVRRADFMEFLEKHAEVGQKAAQSVAKEYREAFLDARRLAISGSASGRLSRLLLDWADSAAHGKTELRFTMALTHEELANMAGTSRETVTRLLNQFERDHLVARHGASIVILEPMLLSQVAS